MCCGWGFGLPAPALLSADIDDSSWLRLFDGPQLERRGLVSLSFWLLYSIGFAVAFGADIGGDAIGSGKSADVIAVDSSPLEGGSEIRTLGPPAIATIVFRLNFPVRLPCPLPFTRENAVIKVRMAEDAWSFPPSGLPVALWVRLPHT